MVHREKETKDMARRRRKKETIYIQNNIHLRCFIRVHFFSCHAVHSGHDMTIEQDDTLVERSRRTVLTTHSHVFVLSTSSYAPSTCALIFRNINRRSALVSSSSSSRCVRANETTDDCAEDEQEESPLPQLLSGGAR